MKSKIIIITFVFISLLFWGCGSQLCLQKRTNRLIVNSHKETDTVYLYSAAFNDFNLVWYYKDNFIYSFWVKPHSTKKHNPIELKNITVNNDSINKYFNNFLFKDIQCFESMLDGTWIKIYIENKEPLFSSLDIDCLFRNKYPINSFPYQLQYYFSKIWGTKYFDFKKLYPNNTE